MLTVLEACVKRSMRKKMRNWKEFCFSSTTVDDYCFQLIWSATLFLICTWFSVLKHSLALPQSSYLSVFTSAVHRWGGVTTMLHHRTDTLMSQFADNRLRPTQALDWNANLCFLKQNKEGGREKALQVKVRLSKSRRLAPSRNSNMTTKSLETLIFQESRLRGLWS